MNRKYPPRESIYTPKLDSYPYAVYVKFIGESDYADVLRIAESCGGYAIQTAEREANCDFNSERDRDAAALRLLDLGLEVSYGVWAPHDPQAEEAEL